jgi:hypothetical protein
MTPPDKSSQKVDAFVARWQGQEGGQERANYALFLTELCDTLDLPHPDPAGLQRERNDYVFERVVTHHRDDGDALGRIDLYRRNSFVLEAKQSRWKGGGKEIAGQNDLFVAQDEPADRGRRGASRAWDVLMLNAKRQAEEYARALPPSHGWPPFILICDVGHCIEVFADFTGQGKNYTQFPDRQSFRVYLEDLRKSEVRDRLRAIWLDPQSLDPTRTAAKATREIAGRLAEVSKALEAKKYPAEEVAQFLMRCLFTMFAASVKLLPEDSFRDLLDDCRNDPTKFVPLLTDLWKSMNGGEFAASIRTKVLKFNGNLFAEAKVLPLGREEIGELFEAAQKDWHEVEPAIFGTLLEQALDPAERRRLGAHYTPRAYVERLVVATIIEPLREDWRNVLATAETKRAAGDANGAADAVKVFHDKLCETRVLDPACGTGNFLYVSMELMKRLEGEVLEALLDLGGQEALRGLGGHTVDPHQFLGLEINPRAAAIAELVLWIGYLQWHFRTRGGTPEQPILRRFKNIEVKNAVLTWDGYPVPQFVASKEAYPSPRRPTWPTAEFIVGNPPFLGKGSVIRDALGDAQVKALWAAHPQINESADFVMYWWDQAAEILTAKGSALRCFGLVTTNSITQEFSRRVISKRLDGKTPISLALAIPDHPWTKATAEAAAVRIAMTVAVLGTREGVLKEVVHETGLDTDEPQIEFSSRNGIINSDLTIGANVTAAVSLQANAKLSSNGMLLAGRGFVLKPAEASHLGLGSRKGLEKHIRPYINGRELHYGWSGRQIIDLYGLDLDTVRSKYPEIYQHLLTTVKVERDIVASKTPVRDAHEYAAKWWLFAKPRRDFRDAKESLARFIGTTETTKHRIFQFIDGSFINDHMVIGIAFDDAYFLGVLSSRIHIVWALRAGGWLGIGNDPRYSKSKIFDPFPFPSSGELLKAQIRTVAEEIDEHRKQRRKEHPSLTLTQIYNVLERLKAVDAAKESVSASNPDSHGGVGKAATREEVVPSLTADEERVKDEGLILILKELHEKLDRLVFQAYGWPETQDDEEILAKLVMLNRERIAEERRGHVRWLRPDYQIPRFGKDVDKQAVGEEGAQITADLGLPEPSARKPSFPTDPVAQTAAVFAALATARGLISADALASNFRKTKALEKTIFDVLASLARLGHVTTKDGVNFEIRRVA